MSINNRYFLYQNKFNPCMISSNVSWLGGTDDGDIYLKIPILLLGKYGQSSQNTQIFNGVCYYFDYMKKPCIKVFTYFDLNFLVPCHTYSFFNYNNKPVFTNSLNEICYYGKGRDSRAENDLKNCWIVNNSYAKVPSLSNFNTSYASEEDWDGYYVNNYTWQNQKQVGFKINNENPQLGDSYTLSSVRVAYNINKTNDSSYFFKFHDKDQIYYRADDAVDLTPQHLKQTDFDLAGKWTTNRGSIIYIGMPIFEYKGDSESIKMIPINKPQEQISKSTPSEIDNLHYNNDSYTIYDYMIGYDNSLLYSYIYHYKSEWNGTSWTSTTEHFNALGWREREQNGGYWREDLTTSNYSVVDEDKPPNTLTWVSLDGKTNKPSLSCAYIGSTIEPNILYKYEKRFPSRFLNLTMHNFNQNYYYNAEDQQ